MTNSASSIPQSVVRRLTRYLAYLQSLSAAGEGGWISSQELAERLGLTSSTVRQDLSHLDFSGTSKRGYDSEGLVRVLTGVLGADKVWRTVVVGAGNLGRALALHEDFSRRGFTICGIFDNDKSKIGEKVGELTVRGMRDLPRVIGPKKVEVGMIAVPAAVAQSVADLLIASGVSGLLNLSLTHIIAPKRVSVIDSRVVSSLLELTHAIKSQE